MFPLRPSEKTETLSGILLPLDDCLIIIIIVFLAAVSFGLTGWSILPRAW